MKKAIIYALVIVSVLLAPAFHAAADRSSADVVSVQVYLTNRDICRNEQSVTSNFKEPRPTRTTVVIAGLVGDGHIENHG